MSRPHIQPLTLVCGLSCSFFHILLYLDPRTRLHGFQQPWIILHYKGSRTVQRGSAIALTLQSMETRSEVMPPACTALTVLQRPDISCPSTSTFFQVHLPFGPEPHQHHVVVGSYSIACSIDSLLPPSSSQHPLQVESYSSLILTATTTRDHDHDHTRPRPRPYPTTATTTRDHDHDHTRPRPRPYPTTTTTVPDHDHDHTRPRLRPRRPYPTTTIPDSFYHHLLRQPHLTLKTVATTSANAQGHHGHDYDNDCSGTTPTATADDDDRSQIIMTRTRTTRTPEPTMTRTPEPTTTTYPAHNDDIPRAQDETHT
ncbi:hypothetical protein BDZ89DRAFT_1115336 [Hymenopellis radicata]|nr:hypothetical protein BDZ89DRAFT_1115336 [Hymenopellis radicata]